MQDGKLLKTGNLTIKAGLRKKDNFCVLYGKGADNPAHISCYDSRESYKKERESDKNKSNKKCHYLDTIKSIDKIIRDSKKEYHLDINTKKEKILLMAESEHDIEDWYKYIIAIQKGQEDSLPAADGSFRKNILYDSSEDTITFDVNIRQSEVARTHFLEGRYRLHVTAGGISLEDPKSYKMLFHWPYQYIRKFGKKKDVFAIDAGRRCDSGEGEFEFELEEPERITHAIDIKTDKKVEARKANTVIGTVMHEDVDSDVSKVTKRTSAPIQDERQLGNKTFSAPRNLRLSTQDSIENADVSKDSGINVGRAFDQEKKFKKTLEKQLSNGAQPVQEKNEKESQEKGEKESKLWGFFGKRGKKGSKSEKNKDKTHQIENVHPERLYDEANPTIEHVPVSNTEGDPMYDDAESVHGKGKDASSKFSPVPVNNMYAEASGDRSEAWKQFAESGDYHEEYYDKVRAAASENQNMDKIIPDKDYEDEDETYDRLTLNYGAKIHRKEKSSNAPDHIYGVQGGKLISEIEDDYTFAEPDQYDECQTPSAKTEKIKDDDDDDDTYDTTYDEAGTGLYDDAESTNLALKGKMPDIAYEDVDICGKTGNSTKI